MKLFCVLLAMEILMLERFLPVNGEEEGDYTNEWVMTVEGGDEVAQEIAQQNNFKIIDKVKILLAIYIPVPKIYNTS